MTRMRAKTAEKQLHNLVVCLRSQRRRSTKRWISSDRRDRKRSGKAMSQSLVFEKISSRCVWSMISDNTDSMKGN